MLIKPNHETVTCSRLVNNKNTRKMCYIYLKLATKTPKRSGVFTVNFGHISHHCWVTRLRWFLYSHTHQNPDLSSVVTLQERARELQAALHNVNEKENQDPSRQRMTSWVVDFSNDNDDQQDTQGMSYCGNLFGLKIWEYCIIPRILPSCCRTNMEN